MQYKLTRLPKISAKAGLRISKSKTKGMRINTPNADNLQLDDVEDFRLRIGKARTAFTILSPV